MPTIASEERTYEVDAQGFLVDRASWDPPFAAVLAKSLGLDELTDEHWAVIRFVQEAFRRNGRCPLVYEVCKANGLSLDGLRRLFPGGYLRGVCRLAGLTYRDAWIPLALRSRIFEEDGLVGASYRDGWALGAEGTAPPLGASTDAVAGSEAKIYRVDGSGFLVDPQDWDEAFAVRKAAEIQPGTVMNEWHWRVIGYLRGAFLHTGRVPTVFETCEANGLDIEGLEKLFPRGYHRGAVKIAGLRAR